MADSGCEDTTPDVKPDMASLALGIKMPDETDANMRARLFTSLSQSFPHSQLYKALHGGDDLILNNGDNSDSDDDSLYGDHLSNSCFASLRMDRRDSDDFDDDLRSLEWLQSEDLLKNIGGTRLDHDESDCEEQKENEDVKPDLNQLQSAIGQQPPVGHPYIPQKHVNSKPPYSFSCLIFMAVENSAKKMLPVKDIYNWILKQFPYFQNAPTGWKNSVRHNLSLNKCFKKVEKDKGQSIGKGSLWCIDPAYRPNLLQALRKTPYHPYHQLQMTSAQPPNYISMQYQSISGAGRTVLPLTQRPIPNTVSPHLFPFLSRRLAQTSFDVDNEMKDVAQTLVSLKGLYKKESPDSPGEDIGPTWKYHKRSYSYNNSQNRPTSPVTVTAHPHDDHAYSSTRLLDDDLPSPSSSSSIDEEYDFGDADEEGESDYDSEWDSDDKDEVDGDLPSTKKLKIDMGDDSEAEEQKKIQEGANALLNLAGLMLGNRSNTNDNSAGKGVGKDENNSNVKKVKKKKFLVSDGNTSKQKEEEVNESKRKSFSKRKNAGSNGKYDSDEYSLLKPKKKAVAGNKMKSKSVKSSSKASTEKKEVTALKGNKIPSSSKAKKIQKSVPNKKLKLSKNFGSKKKTSPKTGTPSNKSSRKRTSDSTVEKKFSVKKLKKASFQDSKIEEETETLKSSDSNKCSNNTNNAINNNNNIVKCSKSSPDVLTSDTNSGVKSDSQSSEADMIPFSSKNPNQTSSDLSVIEPSSIVDAISKSACRSLALDFSESAGDEAPSQMTSSSPEEEAELLKVTLLGSVGLASRSSVSANASPALSPAGKHRSPHFTRFSKKKAALS